jgi:type I restriction enzyme R subunit
MDDYKIIVEQEHQTVMAHYDVEPKPAEGYQSEAKLEHALITQLKGQGYEYAQIKDESELLRNLRLQLEILNDVKFSESEWGRLLPMISNEQMTIQDKTEMIQGKGYILNLKLDNGQSKNIKLIDKANVFNNRLQVINQYEVADGAYKNRYDVTILVNGLPLVHIELKRRGVDIKEAFNQINRYLRDSFWAGRAMFDFVQIFVISNGTETKYYSNTTRYAKEQEAISGPRKHKTEGNTFEFTSYWTDQENTLLTDIRDFTKTFFAKHTILNILTKYCVFNVDKQLLVMRPYQIAATEKILQRIQTAIYNKWQGTIKAGGYIWHTTGSGKTLTSFKTAQLASKMEGINKVLFIVDRKDLDYQTMKEYDNFEPNCANSNSSSKILLQQLKDDSVRIIITTIQKLSNLMKPKFEGDERLKEILTKDNIVLIFDECHRSQFGDMRQDIAKKFKRYFMFGFTGTPIFAINAHVGSKYSTTAQLFGGEPDEQGKPTKALHTYTIVNAIRDKNVLRFHVDYESTMKMKSGVDSKMVWGIDTDEALHNPKRISIITRYIIDHFAEKTKQNAEVYAMSRLTNVQEVVRKGRNVEEEKAKFKTRGFNSLFAVDSVKSAIMYYHEFKKQLAEPGAPNLKVATIYTYAANEPEEDEWGLGDDENPEGVGELDLQSRDALAKAIDDYNHFWEPNTSYTTDGDSFQNYYKDVSLRMKNKQIDILIVVGMFLTGFDAKTLNTLWVDKNLKMHGLLQAYSRTNRILNAVKNCGNIVCFRNLEDATKKSIAIFGDPNASGLVFLKSYQEYYETGYDDEKGNHHTPYILLIRKLLEEYPVETIANILDDQKKKNFIRLMGEILRVRNILVAFDDFTVEAKIVDEMRYQDYLGWYNRLHDEFRPTTHDEKESINDDIVFEMELVKQVQINIPYILRLVQEYHDSNCQDKTIIVKIQKQIEASPDMRDKKELIQKFIDRMTPEGGSSVENDWEEFIDQEKIEQLDAIIEEEHLKPQETRAFIDRAFKDGYVTETGTGIAKILPPSNPFLPESGEKKQTVIDKLKAYLNKFLNTSE